MFTKAVQHFGHRSSQPLDILTDLLKSPLNGIRGQGGFMGRHD